MDIVFGVITVYIIQKVNSADVPRYTQRGQLWIKEDSIQDGYFKDIILTHTADRPMQCLLICMELSNCITIGYSQIAESCDIYGADLTAYKSKLTSQDSTIFYKAACGADGYTYVRHIKLCMKIYDEEVSFQNAVQVCQSEGGNLIRVMSEEVRYYLRSILKHHVNIPYWVGLVQDSQTGWQWLDRTSLTLSFWGVGEPSHGSEKCGFVRDTGSKLYLYDMNCDDMLKFMCEIY